VGALRLKKILPDTRGITAIITALLLPVILLFFSAILDAASVVLTERQLQVVTDAGAAAAVTHFEIFGELQGASFVPRARVTAGAPGEANTAISLNTASFDFVARGIVITENTQSGVGTDSYTVTLRARVPTLIMGQLHNALMGGTGQFNTIEILAVSTSRIIVD
jgi:uncharacterized membrane protein